MVPNEEIAHPSALGAESAPQKSSTLNQRTKTAIIGGLALILGAVVVAFVLVLVFRNLPIGLPDGSPYLHTAYFVPQSVKSNTKYALVNQKGEKLTDFNIEKYSTFIDGYALIRTDEGWCIISQDGKITVKPGEYDGLARVGGLYSAMKAGGKRKLLHGSGRVITDFDTEQNSNLSNTDYNYEDALVVAIGRGDDKYDLYNAHGQSMGRIESSETPTISYYTRDGLTDSVTAVSYSNGFIVVSNNDLKELARITDAKKIYHIDQGSYDHKLFVLANYENSSTKGGDLPVYEDIAPTARADSKYQYAFIYNGKFVEIGKKCSSLSINNAYYNNTGSLYCYSSSGSGYLDEQGNMYTAYDYTSGNYKYHLSLDISHHAVWDRSARTVKLGAKTISNITRLAAYGDTYLAVIDGAYQLLDSDGEKTCSLPLGATVFRGFDDQSVAVVGSYASIYSTTSTGGYYLIDRSCNKLSDKYYSISALGKYYLVTNVSTSYDSTTSYSNRNYSYGLLDKSGKKAIDFGKYERFSRASYQGDAKDLLIATKSDNKRVLLNENLEEIAEFTGTPSADYDQELLKVRTEKFQKYFTYEGKEIYSLPLGDGAESRT